MKTIGIIMAGGAGERFWPLSRRAYPKQLLKIGQDKTMLDLAIERLEQFIPSDDIYIITASPLKKAILNSTRKVSPANIIEEPEGRNTAPCLALAGALCSRSGDEDCLLLAVAADHFVRDKSAFANDCLAALDFAEKHDALVTFGIRPGRPETGYGYIEPGAAASDTHPVFHVTSFREKPDRGTAERFLADGTFLWNSGIFVWRKSVFEKGLEKSAPALHHRIPDMIEALSDPDPTAALAPIYQSLEKVSIDVALLEQSDNVYVLRASFDWDDIGAWSSLHRVLKRDVAGNALFGEAVLLRSEDSIAYSVGPGGSSKGGRTIVGYHLNGMVIVSTPDAVMVLPADEVQDVKEIVKYLRCQGKEEIL